MIESRSPVKDKVNLDGFSIKELESLFEAVGLTENDYNKAANSFKKTNNRALILKKALRNSDTQNKLREILLRKQEVIKRDTEKLYELQHKTCEVFFGDKYIQIDRENTKERQARVRIQLPYYQPRTFIIGNKYPNSNSSTGFEGPSFVLIGIDSTNYTIKISVNNDVESVMTLNDFLIFIGEKNIENLEIKDTPISKEAIFGTN